MTNTIIPHLFNNSQIAQMSEDTVLAGKIIPKGYCNATQMCQANGKRWSNYSRLKSTKDYLEALSLDDYKVSIQLVVEIEGTPNGDASLQGTWVHPEIALDLAQWISIPFRVWANRTLKAVLENKTDVLEEELKEAQAHLREQWNKVRQAGKAIRRSLTDAIKDWYERNPNGSSRPMGIMIAQTTNLVYQALWGMDALQLETLLGCDRNESRDNLSNVDLGELKDAEKRVCEYIDLDNVKPVDAVKLANIRKKNRPTSK